MRMRLVSNKKTGGGDALQQSLLAALHPRTEQLLSQVVIVLPRVKMPAPWMYCSLRRSSFLVMIWL
jgi:hypothetical protein